MRHPTQICRKCEQLALWALHLHLFRPDQLGVYISSVFSNASFELDLLVWLRMRFDP